MPHTSFAIGLDLGQAHDWTARAILQRIDPEEPEKKKGEQKEQDKQPAPQPIFHVRDLYRFPLGTPYPRVIADTKDLLGKDVFGEEPPQLIVDATGVGRPVVDQFNKEQVFPIAVTITGGDQTTNEGLYYRVPKRDLVSNLQVLFQSGRLKIAEALPLAPILVKELKNFRAKITTAGNDTYEAWRENDHDDLLLALALAAWWSVSRGGVGKIFQVPRFRAGRERTGGIVAPDLHSNWGRW
jgi:hypothetical protein